jgi:hypothetical protein
MCSAQVWGLSPRATPALLSLAALPPRTCWCCSRLRSPRRPSVGSLHASGCHAALYNSAPYRLYHSYGVPWVCRKRQKEGVVPSILKAIGYVPPVTPHVSPGGYGSMPAVSAILCAHCATAWPTPDKAWLSGVPLRLYSGKKHNLCQALLCSIFHCFFMTYGLWKARDSPASCDARDHRGEIARGVGPGPLSLP